MSKDLPALRTLVGLFTGVRSLVSVEVGVAREAFSTYVTLIGLLACVGALMASQVGILTEAFSTFEALMGLFSQVCSVQ